MKKKIETNPGAILAQLIEGLVNYIAWLMAAVLVLSAALGITLYLLLSQ